MKNFSESAIHFFNSLDPKVIKTASAISVLDPYRDKAVMAVVVKFYNRFFRDKQKRILILGINPGRFGAGATGIAFTDPVRLENECGIKNHLPKKPELSSSFIYEVIRQYGGAGKFYKSFFLGAVCPLGFIKSGKNINYYDDKKLLVSVRQFIINSIRAQIELGSYTRAAICLGEGKNFKFISDLNDEYKFFEKIIPLPHPRYIMQYRRKQLQKYINLYEKAFEEASLINFLIK